MNSINFHRVISLEVSKTEKLHGNTCVRELIITDGDGRKTEISFFSEDKKNISIKTIK